MSTMAASRITDELRAMAAPGIIDVLGVEGPEQLLFIQTLRPGWALRTSRETDFRYRDDLTDFIEEDLGNQGVVEVMAPLNVLVQAFTCRQFKYVVFFFHDCSELAREEEFFNIFACYPFQRLWLSAHEICKDVGHVNRLFQALRSNASLTHLHLKGLQFRNPLTHLSLWERTEKLPRSSISLAYLRLECMKIDLSEASPLASALTANKTLRTLNLSGNQIQSEGASILASALAANSALQTLDISDNYIDSEGATSLASSLKKNSTLHTLDLSRNEIDSEGASSLASTLSRNRTLHTLDLSDNKIDSEGAYSFASALSANTTLHTLDLSLNKIDSKGASRFASVLKTNKTLHSLNLSRNEIPFDVAAQITSAMARNSTSLDLYIVNLKAFWIPSFKLRNRTHRTLCVSKMGIEGAVALARMIETNTTLIQLNIQAKTSLNSSDIVETFRALGKNASLTTVSLAGCQGVDGREVYDAILDALTMNVCLKALDLSDTPIQLEPQWILTIENLLRQANENQQFISTLEQLPKVPPTTARVFLCGHGFAGKTTLSQTIIKILRRDSIMKRIIHHRHFIDTALNRRARTMGIEVTSVEYQSTRISFWDMAGQPEYQAFHDLMFPNEQGPTLFLIVCNPTIGDLKTKPAPQMRRELEYWIRYISSNTRKSKRRTPHVAIIFTHEDKLPTKNYDLQSWAEEYVPQLRREFEGIAMVGKHFLIDSYNREKVRQVADYVSKESETILRSCPSIYGVCNEVRHVLAEWMVDHPSEPCLKWAEFIRVCTRKVPQLRFDSDELAAEVTELRRAVLYSLHASGHVIYFHELDLIVVNPGWFCNQFMGRIIHMTTLSFQSSGSLDSNRDEGVWGREQIERMWLKNNSEGGSRRRNLAVLSMPDLVGMMLQLELCCEVDPGKPGSDLFIPATLLRKEGTKPTWKPNSLKGPLIYVGRRLKCENEKHIFLTPGFFPRIQIYLKKMFQELPESSTTRYKVEKDLIKIDADRLEILVEFSQEPVSFIDILVRSWRSRVEALKFVRDFLIKPIVELQALSARWQGVLLVEAVIRPSCVRNLTPCERRGEHSVLVAELKKTLLIGGVAGIEERAYPWPDAPDLLEAEKEQSVIKELLGDQEFEDVLERRLEHLKDVGKKLLVWPTATSDGSSGRKHDTRDSNSKWKRTRSVHIENSFEAFVYDTMSELQSDVEVIKTDVKEIKTDVKDVKNTVIKLVKQEELMVKEIQKMLTKLLSSSTTSTESKVPRLFVFVKEDKLITKLVPGLRSLKLQFMCEHREQPHVPSKRLPGCELRIVENDTLKKLLPYMRYFLSAITVGLKVGAHVAGGMASLVPDLSNAMDGLIQATGLALDAVMTMGTSNVLPEGAPPPPPPPHDTVMHSGNVGHYNDGEHAVKIAVARAWVEEFVSSQGCAQPIHIYEKFGLLKKESGGEWLCDEHFALAHL